MGKITELKMIRVEKLVPYQKNAKKHSETQVDAIANSIEEFGFLSPILIDKDYNIIAGHGRVLACKKLGILEAPCMFAEGLTEEQRRAYILADNKLTEMGEWDPELISEELQDLKGMGFDIELTGFSFDDIITDDFTFIEDQQVAEDPEEEPEAKRGDIWRLGRHLLMCGDSTRREDVQKLLQGNRMDCVITDPPYGVDYKDLQEFRFEAGRNNNAGKVIENDNIPEAELGDFLVSAFENMNEAMKEGAAFYVFYAASTGVTFETALEQAGLKSRQQLIWVKQRATLGRQDYQWQHEPVLYGWKEGAGHYFIDDRTKTTVMEKVGEVDLEKITLEEARRILRDIQEEALISTTIHESRPMRSEEHPTMKPVNLLTRFLLNSTKPGEKVLDLFGGSGSTMMACEQTERKCYMMELDPGYIEVIIDRWERFTGEKAVKL